MMFDWLVLVALHKQKLLRFFAARATTNLCPIFSIAIPTVTKSCVDVIK